MCAQVQKSQVEVIDLKLSVVKFLGAKSMDKWYDYLKLKPEIVFNGFRGAGTYTVAMLYTPLYSKYTNNYYMLYHLTSILFVTILIKDATIIINNAIYISIRKNL